MAVPLKLAFLALRDYGIEASIIRDTHLALLSGERISWSPLQKYKVRTNEGVIMYDDLDALIKALAE